MVKTFLNIAQIRQIEIEALTKHKLNLMDLAVNCIVKLVKNKFLSETNILILIGGGNNGGDGALTAIKLKKLGYNPTICKVITKLNPYTEELLKEFSALGGNTSSRLPLNLNN
jgi:NAD(P)H-hydrate repair Nnr-like enzyme with NAD(P)H-hydrate epimerase domain